MPTIRVSEKVLEGIQELQGPRETYNDVLQVLLSTYEVANQLTKTIGPAHYLRDKPKVEA